VQNFSVLPQEILISFWKNRSLIISLIKRDISGRYKGSLLGILWSLINPIFMLMVYTFVFSVVFNARWTGGSDSKTEFALVLFAGLIVFNLFSECFNRSPGLILANVNFVKKVIFPLEILSFVSLGAALFNAVISYAVWIVAYIIFYGLPHLTILLLPIVLTPLFIFILGIGWLFSSLGVYIRDISQLVGMLTTVLLFLSPIFFPISALPENYQIFIKLNPLAPVIEQSRQVLFWGNLPNPYEYGLCLIVALIIACFGFYWFQKTRKGFADVI
jgi:lipopolysaccharide transport system permease protein